MERLLVHIHHVNQNHIGLRTVCRATVNKMKWVLVGPVAPRYICTPVEFDLFELRLQLQPHRGRRRGSIHHHSVFIIGHNPVIVNYVSRIQHIIVYQNCLRLLTRVGRHYF